MTIVGSKVPHVSRIKAEVGYKDQPPTLPSTVGAARLAVLQNWHHEVSERLARDVAKYEAVRKTGAAGLDEWEKRRMGDTEEEAVAAVIARLYVSIACKRQSLLNIKAQIEAENGRSLFKKAV